ncbi:MAG: CHAT domain-containing protein [Synechococcaceae cyanobacterium]|nr:CHAT domain-containing protein [Synechococcaceae cyanobacterium]
MTGLSCRHRLPARATGLLLAAAAWLSASPWLGQAARAASGRPALTALRPATSAAAGNAFDAERYTPAVLRLSVTPDRDGRSSLIDLTLIPVEGELVGRRVTISTTALAEQLRELYGRLAKQQPMEVENPASPSRQLYRLLLEPLAADLQRLGITTLLVSADPGLQAIPFAALHDGSTYVGERYAMALTPSLGLTPLDVPKAGAGSRQLAVGASKFEGLSPLPLVPQELERVTGNTEAERYIDTAFTPDVLLLKAGEGSIDRVHVATHAEFLPGGPAQAKLYTGTGPLSLSQFASLRQRRSGSAPLELIALSACRTALGDKDSELGFAGLALQAGARSAIGTLWYVDDVATSAFFVQFYRYLNDGLPKAEALQATRRAMAEGGLRPDGDRVLGPDGSVVLKDLTISQQRRIASGLRHPFYWAGITLLGTPW